MCGDLYRQLSASFPKPYQIQTNLVRINQCRPSCADRCVRVYRKGAPKNSSSLCIHNPSAFSISEEEVRIIPSSSIQSFGGTSVGIISNSAFGSSSLCKPIICSSLIHRDALMAAFVNHILRASAVAMSAQACAWATVRKCSPSPYTRKD